MNFLYVKASVFEFNIPLTKSFYKKKNANFNFSTTSKLIKTTGTDGRS